MENASLPSDLWNNLTTSSSKDDDETPYRFTGLTLQIVYVVVGTVGVLDNLFVIITFALFIKITVKQVAQLSQRDRAAGWVSNGQKWKTGTERQYLRTI